MSDLPPYSGEHVKCPKCGHGECATRYVPPRVTGRGGTRGERLDRVCGRCTHTWAEATIEQKPAAREGV